MGPIVGQRATRPGRRLTAWSGSRVSSPSSSRSWACWPVAAATSASEQSGDTAAASSSGSSAAAGGDDEHYQPTDEDRQQIRALLTTRAKALEQGDRQAFLATVDPDDDKLVKQQTTLYDNLQLLPVESVSYSVDDGAGYPTADVPRGRPGLPARGDRAGAARRRHPAGEQHAGEHVRTARRRTGCSVRRACPGSTAQDGEPQSRPWAGSVPIAVARSGRLLVVTDRDGEVAPQSLADDIADDIRFDAEALGIAPSYDVLVDATTVGDAHQMNSVDDAEAAAVTFPVGSFTTDGGGRPAGMRIKVNPDEAARVAADDQVMRHELTHFLTLERLAGAPTWIKEGLAEWTSTAPATLDDLVVAGDAYEHVMEVRRRLPTGGRWGLDPQADYLIGRAAVTHLVAEYGPDAVLALGAAYRRDPRRRPRREDRRRAAQGVRHLRGRPRPRPPGPSWGRCTGAESVTDPDDLARRGALDRLDVRAGGVGDGDRRGTGEHRAVGVPRLLEHRRADRVDADAAGQLDRGRPDEGVDAAVDGRRDGTGEHRLDREDARHQRERTAVGDVGQTEPHHSTWPSSLSRNPASHWSDVSSASGPYGVLPAVHTTASTCPTEPKRPRDGGGVGEVDEVLPRPRGRHHLVPVPQRGDDGRAQPARGADHQHLHLATLTTRPTGRALRPPWTDRAC